MLNKIRLWVREVKNYYMKPLPLYLTIGFACWCIAAAFWAVVLTAEVDTKATNFYLAILFSVFGFILLLVIILGNIFNPYQTTYDWHNEGTVKFSLALLKRILLLGYVPSYEVEALIICKGRENYPPFRPFETFENNAVWEDTGRFFTTVDGNVKKGSLFFRKFMMLKKINIKQCR